MSDQLLTPSELAAHLRTSERTVQRLVADGCPSMLLRRQRRFALPTVLAWMASRADLGATECRSDATPMAAGTPRLASSVADYTAACRRVQLRATPSASRQS